MKKAFRKSLKRQTSLGGYFKNYSNRDNHSVTHITGTPILWQALARKYQLNYPRDWYKVEAHWLDQIESFQEQPIDCPGRDGKMNNAIIRISQCNESYQLCNSLPRSFIVPKDLKDVTLMNIMSTVIKDHRVPVVSYCCPIEYRRTFIIRCASSDQQARITEILAKVVKPMKVFNLTESAPSLEKVESPYRKLRDACRPKEEDQVANFVARSGKWLNIVSTALKIVKETANTLLTEASVILIEDDDRGWNSLVSSLVQLLLEPHRRTMEGFESLISKEWIYLAGGPLDYSQPDILFTLFLDCSYQIYLQNISEFEFTSEYLRYLHDAQYICIPEADDNIKSNNNNNNNNNNKINSCSRRTNGVISKSKTTSCTHDEEDVVIHDSQSASYKPSSMSMVDLNLAIKNGLSNEGSPNHVNLIEAGYNVTMFNPFYEPNRDSPKLTVYDHIVNVKLWSSLYLRWMQPRIKYGCIEETIYFQLNHPQASSAITTLKE